MDYFIPNPEDYGIKTQKESLEFLRKLGFVTNYKLNGYAKNVKDINGMCYLTKDNELYRCYDSISYQVGDDLFKNVLVSSDVISIVKTRTHGECIYNKKDGTYYVGTGIYYSFPMDDYKPIKICSGKFALSEKQTLAVEIFRKVFVFNTADVVVRKVCKDSDIKSHACKTVVFKSD